MPNQGQYWHCGPFLGTHRRRDRECERIAGRWWISSYDPKTEAAAEEWRDDSDPERYTRQEPSIIEQALKLMMLELRREPYPDGSRRDPRPETLRMRKAGARTHLQRHGVGPGAVDERYGVEG
jgi:hypothetical protein